MIGELMLQVRKLNEEMKSKLLYILIFFPFLQSLSQNYDWVKHDSLVKAGINQIYGIEFDKAEKTFDRIIKEYPTHPSGKFFKAMTTWWRILLDLDNESMDDKFYDQLEEVIDMCDDILDKNARNVDAMFFKGGALGFRGRLRAIRESWFKAALDGKEGLGLVFKAYQANPKNVDIQLGFGIYHYYAEVIPQKYPAVKPFMIFFPKGDKTKGLKELENVAWNGRYARIEARYFLPFDDIEHRLQVVIIVLINGKPNARLHACARAVLDAADCRVKCALLLAEIVVRLGAAVDADAHIRKPYLGYPSGFFLVDDGSVGR